MITAETYDVRNVVSLPQLRHVIKLIRLQV